MRVNARLGNLSLSDDYNGDQDTKYKQLLTIEGDNLADFQYEKYDAHDAATYPGYDSMVYLRSGSFRFTFVQGPMHRILRFLTKFGRMKAVYDATTNAAAQQATEISNQASKMHYDILVHTPILVFPHDQNEGETLVANLGEMSVNNTFASEGPATLTKITATLSKIRLSSSPKRGEMIQMLRDVDLKFDITMAEGQERRASTRTRPDTEVRYLGQECPLQSLTYCPSFRSLAICRMYACI
jgi:vacuolar protein sorting-associated protein 13A/C